MRNTFINFYRKKKNRATSCEPSDSYVFINEDFAEDNNAGSNIMMGELSQIIGKLDETYRKPFLMFFEGFKYEEIATDMALPIGTIKSRIFFARQKLRDSITHTYNYDTTTLN